MTERNNHIFRNRVLIPVVAGLFLFGCDGHDATDVPLPAKDSANVGQVLRETTQMKEIEAELQKSGKELKTALDELENDTLTIK